MDIINYIGSAFIQANGGQGGSENDNGNVGRCYGAGGGGSGGAIYLSGAVPGVTITANGGAAGLETGRDASCNPIVLAIAGSAGQIIPDYTYSTSSVLASSYCGVLLPLKITVFKAEYILTQTRLNWKITDPESVDRFIVERAGDNNTWAAIYEQYAEDDITVYQATDPFPQIYNNFYRLKIIGKKNEITYSDVQKVFVPALGGSISVYPNPAANKIIVKGVGAFADLFLFDLTGKLIWQKKNNTSQTNAMIDLAHVPAGIYVLKIGVVIKKVILR
jgi:hypothetical protein